MKRIAQLMGYQKVITYTLAEESGTSLRAVGAQVVGEVQPQEWNVPSRPRKSQEVYGRAKLKWELRITSSTRRFVVSTRRHVGQRPIEPFVPDVFFGSLILALWPSKN